MHKQLRALIKAVAIDHTSGAFSLTLRSAEVLKEVHRRYGPKGTAAPGGELEAVCRALISAQPAMASIFNLANMALLEGNVLAVEAFILRMRENLESLSRNAASIIGERERVLAHSASSAVERAFLRARDEGKSFEVICTESRPLREGVGLAKRLSRRGIPVKLMADAAAASFISEISRVFVGGDALSPEGLLNKVGTYPLALAAREAGAPFFVLCGSEKFIPHIRPEAAKAPKPGRELLSHSLRGVKVVNYYFDLTPLNLITSIIWEEGFLGEEALRRRLEEVHVYPALSAPSGPKKGSGPINP